MKPNPQFMQMIVRLFEQRKQSITRPDLDTHNIRAVSFYSLSQAKLINDRVVSKTEVFSDQIMIEIGQGGKTTIIGTPSSQTVYTRTLAIQFDTYNNKGYLHWQAKDAKGTLYLFAKLMADDNTCQIKIVNTSDNSQIIHNVVEFPM